MNFEYPDKAEAPQGALVFVKIFSTQSDMTGELFLSEASQDAECYEDILDSSEKMKSDGNAGAYVLTTEGYLSCCDKSFSLKYIQKELADADCETEISFDFDKPKAVTVTRSGGLNSTIIIEEGVRQYSSYETPFGVIDMCVLGKKVDNRLTGEGGILILDYAVELMGMTAQRTKMRINIKK